MFCTKNLSEVDDRVLYEWTLELNSSKMFMDVLFPNFCNVVSGEERCVTRQRTAARETSTRKQCN